MLLELKGVTLGYGKGRVVRDVSLSIEEKGSVGILGANGAGKTSLLRYIVGLLHGFSFFSGEIYFKGKRIDKLPPYERARLGLVLVPEGRRLFPFLTVKENLLLGASCRKDTKEIERDLEFVYSLFPRLKERERQKANTLSGGEQQMLAIGRGLMAKPELLIMDEPSLGLSPLLVQELGRTINRIIEEKGIGLLLAEQNASLALRTCKRCYLMRLGQFVFCGSPHEIERSDYLKFTYLGGELSNS
ncbi:MAG: ABC transporter ATP-binding protein [Candidatus Bathyarchaeia archaeon]